MKAFFPPFTMSTLECQAYQLLEITDTFLLKENSSYFKMQFKS